jgi:hypothetical protein
MAKATDTRQTNPPTDAVRVFVEPIAAAPDLRLRQIQAIAKLVARAQELKRA